MDNVFSLNTIVIIFLILLPGIIIRRTFYSDKFSKQFYRGQFSERLITTIFWGIINALIGLLLSSLLLKLFFINDCLSCIAQSKIHFFLNFDYQTSSLLFDSFSFKYLIFIALFCLNLFLLPALLGRIGFVIIRKFKLDLKFPPLSFSNHWHYFFSGEVLTKNKHLPLSSGVEFRKNKSFVPVVDILTIEGDKKYFYKGILVDYNLKDQNEELDSLVLFKALKKNYDKDIIDKEKQTFLDFKRIPGELLLIPYSTVLNINVSIKELNKPTPSNNIQIVSAEKASRKSEEKKDENGALGCLIAILIPILFYAAAQYSKEISYLRFLIGLTGVFLALGIFTFMIQNLFKKFKSSRLFWIILFLLLFVIFYLLIFNIYTFPNLISF